MKKNSSRKKGDGGGGGKENQIRQAQNQMIEIVPNISTPSHRQ